VPSRARSGKSVWVPGSHRRDEHQVGCDSQDAKGDQHHPAAFGPLGGNLADKDEAGKDGCKPGSKSAPGTFSAFRERFLRYAGGWQSPIIMIGMEHADP